MISELRITDPENTCIKWWPNVPWLKGRTSIEFKPGLNILWGPNGSGKSTVIKCIAKMLHAEQGMSPCPTHSSIRDLFETFKDRENEGYKDGAVPIHDGEAIMYFDPMNAVGLYAGGAAFDDDFFLQGVQNTMFKGSSGQTTLQRFDSVVGAIVTRKWPDIDWSKSHGYPSKMAELPPKATSQIRERQAWLVTNTLKGTLEKGGLRTVLLDEPDRSLDLPFQWGVWHRLASEKGVQIIAASHSLVALGIDGANYIEFADGYLAKSKQVLDLVAERAILGMDDLPNEIKLSFLDTLIKRSEAQAPRRDPRVDPRVGDVIRVRVKGQVQIREVTKVNLNPDDPGRSWMWWKEHQGKGGSKLFIESWQKLAKDGTVLRVGVN